MALFTKNGRGWRPFGSGTNLAGTLHPHAADYRLPEFNYRTAPSPAFPLPVTVVTPVTVAGEVATASAAAAVPSLVIDPGPVSAVVATGSAAGIAAATNLVYRSNSAEGGTNGVDVSAANSGGASGDAWSAVTTLGTIAPKYTTSHARGAMGIALNSIIGGQAQTVEWWTLGGFTTDVWFRFYLYIPTLTSESLSLAKFWTSGGVSCGTLKLTSGNAVTFADTAGTNRASGSVALTSGQRVRIEGRIRPSTTAGQLEWWLYKSEDSATPDDHAVATGLVLAASVDRVYFGWTTSSNAPNSVQTWVMDDLAFSNAGPIPPAAALPVSVAGEVATGSAIGVAPTLAAAEGGVIGAASGVGVAPSLSGQVAGVVATGSADGPAVGGVYTQVGLLNTAEGQADGTTPTTGNSGGGSGDAFATVNGMSGVCTFSADRGHRGTQSYKFVVPASSATPYVRMGALGGVTSERFGGHYFYLTAYPTAASRLIGLMTVAPALSAGVKLQTNGTVQPVNAANANTGSASTALPLNQWIRIEWRLLPGTAGAGQVEWRLWWTDPDGTGTPDYTSNLSGQSLGADLDHARIGQASASTQSVPWTFYLDDIAFDTTSFGHPTIPASGNAATLVVEIPAPSGSASAAGIAPTLLVPVSVTSVVATGSAVGVVPTLTIVVLDVTVDAVVATGSAVGVVPSLAGAVGGGVATGSAVGVAASLDARIAGVVASGSAVGTAAVLAAALTGGVATGSAAGVTATVTPMQRRNNFEGGTNGVAVTTANSGGTSGDPFDSLSTSPACLFTSGGNQRGSMGLLLTSIVGGQQQRVAWRNLGAITTDIWIRGYLKVSALPSQGCVILRVTDNSINQTAALKITASNKIAAADAAGTNKGSGAVTVSTNRIRFEVRYKPSTTAGELEWWLYNTEDSIVEDDHSLVINQVLGANIDGIDWGWVSGGNAPSAAVTWVLDDLAISSSGKIGAATPIAYPPVATGSAVGVAPTLPATGVVAFGSAVAVVPVLKASVAGVVATGSASGATPAPTVSRTAVVATGTATGVAPTVVGAEAPGVGAGSAVGVTPALAAALTGTVATGSAVGISAGSAEVVPAGVASGAAAGIAPTSRAYQTAVVASGSAIGVGAAVLPVYPGVASGSAIGVAPTFISGYFVYAPTAAAPSAGVAPSLKGAIVAPAAGTPAAAGVVPLVTRGVAPPVAIGSAVGVTAALRATIGGVVATGSAAGVAPVTGRGVLSPAASASAVGIVAVGFKLGILTVATGSGVGVLGILTRTVTAVVATGGGVGTAPTRRVAITTVIATASGNGVAPTLSFSSFISTPDPRAPGFGFPAIGSGITVGYTQQTTVYPHHLDFASITDVPALLGTESRYAHTLYNFFADGEVTGHADAYPIGPQEEWCFANGITPIINLGGHIGGASSDFPGWGTTTPSQVYPLGTLCSGDAGLIDIAAGVYDDQVKRWADALKKLSSKAYVRMWREPTAPNGVPGVDTNGHAYSTLTPANYIAAYRRVWTIFYGTALQYAALGISGAPYQLSQDALRMIWCVGTNSWFDTNGANGNSYNQLQCYPGDAYTNVLAGDGYGTNTWDGQTFKGHFGGPPGATGQSWYDWAKGRGMPLMICETGVDRDESDAPGDPWVLSIPSGLKAMPEIRAIVLWAGGLGHPAVVEDGATPAVQAAWQQVFTDPYMRGRVLPANIAAGLAPFISIVTNPFTREIRDGMLLAVVTRSRTVAALVSNGRASAAARKSRTSAALAGPSRTLPTVVSNGRAKAALADDGVTVGALVDDGELVAGG